MQYIKCINFWYIEINKLILMKVTVGGVVQLFGCG